MSYPTFLTRVEREIRDERERQDAKFGEQNHDDGTGDFGHARELAGEYRALNDAGKATWQSILLEEVYEAMAEDDPEKLRTELLQVAATAVTWVDAIDRRKATP